MSRKTPANSQREAIKLARRLNSDWEKVIYSDRPYQLPKQYIKWRDWCCMAGVLMDGCQTDTASLLHYARTVLWLGKNAPLYCVTAELVERFKKTDLPTQPGNSLVNGLGVPIETALFCFPKKLIKNPDGGWIESVVFHLSDVRSPQNSQVSYRGKNLAPIGHEHGDRINIQWSSIDTRTTVWFSGIGMDEEGSLIWRDRTDVGATQMSEGDRAFTKGLTNVIIQCWLAACYQPQLLHEHIPELSPKGFDRYCTNYRNDPPVWHPRYLALPKAVKSDRTSSPHGTHASPHAHWRRGHWRNQVVGTGRSERKLIWVQPIYVSPHQL